MCTIIWHKGPGPEWVALLAEPGWHHARTGAAAAAVIAQARLHADIPHGRQGRYSYVIADSGQEWQYASSLHEVKVAVRDHCKAQAEDI